jgi:hypothetical protein
MADTLLSLTYALGKLPGLKYLLSCKLCDARLLCRRSVMAATSVIARLTRDDDDDMQDEIALNHPYMQHKKSSESASRRMSEPYFFTSEGRCQICLSRDRTLCVDGS